MRLFVAITPPEDVLDDLDQWISGLTDSVEGIDERYRWSLRSQRHLTLAFCGEVDASKVPELRSRLDRAAARHQPLWLTLQRGGAFSSAARARVLWAGIGGDTEPLRALARSVAAGVRRAGIPVEERRYRPHITLARFAQPTDARAAVTALEEYLGPWWAAREVELIRSHLGRDPDGRAAYETIERWPLGGTG